MTSSSIKLLDYEKVETLDDLVFDKIRMRSDNYRHIDVFIDSNTLQRPIIKTPWLSAPYEISTHDNGKSTLMLSLIPLMGKREDFVNYMKKLDKLILKKFQKRIGEDVTYKPIIKKKPGHKYPYRLIADLPSSKKNKPLYKIINSNKQLVNATDFEGGCNVMVILELAGIWIGEEEFSCSWNALYIKIQPIPDYSKLLFTDGEIINCLNESSENDSTTNDNTNDNESMEAPPAPPLIIDQEPETPQKKSIKKTKKKEKIEPVSNQSDGRYAPTVNELLEMKGRLKKCDIPKNLRNDKPKDISKPKKKKKNK